MKSQTDNFYRDYFTNLGIIISTILLAAILLSGCAKSEAVMPTISSQTLPVMHIATTSAITEVEFPSAIQGTTDIEIRPQVIGTLDKVFEDEGAYVTKGEPLFKINDRPYVELLNTALANKSAAEAAALNAQLEVDKLTPLVQNKVISDYQLKTAKANLSIAKANIEQSRAAVASARINLGYTLIKAPVDGYIGRLQKKQGSQINPADPEAMTTISDIKQVHAYFSLGESEFMAFKSQYPGKTLADKLVNLPPVTLVLADNSVYSQSGKIDMVDGQFDKTTGAITLRATFPNPNGLLRSGNTGKVRLTIRHPNSLVVPQNATIEIQDKIFVVVVDKKNAVARRPVIVKAKSGTDYLISDGIEIGDRIVVKGFESLADGTIITPETAQRPVAKL